MSCNMKTALAFAPNKGLITSNGKCLSLRHVRRKYPERGISFEGVGFSRPVPHHCDRDFLVESEKKIVYLTSRVHTGTGTRRNNVRY